MSKKESNVISNQFKKEYKWFIEKYLFRLLGIVNKQLKYDQVAFDEDIAYVAQADDAIYFSVNRCRLFRLDLEGSQRITEDNIKLANRIIQEFLPLSEYKRTDSKRQNNSYPNSKERPGAYAVYRDYI